MAKSTNQGFLSGDQSAAKIRRDFIEKPMAAAKLSMVGTGLELFEFLRVLPNAFIASQERELERVKATSEKNDARVASLEASIAQATTLRTTIQRGEARVDRAMTSFGDQAHAFHGFVSNEEFEPIKGLTVRLISREAGKRGLMSTTDDDGYFRISLGSKSNPEKERSEQVGEISFAQKLNMFELGLTAKREASVNANAAGEKPVAQVEILNGNEVVFTDSNTLPTTDGSVYREYVLTNVKPRHEGYYETSEEMPTEEPTLERVKRTTKKRATKKRTKK